MDEFFSGRSIAGSLAGWDILIVAGSVALLLLIAFVTGRKEKDIGDFFLGARRVPMIIAAMSLVATEVSAVTITNVPGTGYSNLQYLQFYIGSAASKIFVAFLFLPVFYKHQCTSIYEFLRDRFGRPTQLSGSIFFFVTRLLASGARLYAACLAISLIMNWHLWHSLLLFTLASVAFIAFGGIKAVVWTGAYQASIFYVAGLAVIVYIFVHISGGMDSVWAIAGKDDHLSIFNWGWNLNDAGTFWAGTANAFFVGVMIFGTDQELVQRLLTVKTRRSSQGAILSTIVAALPVTVIYLVIGTLMFVFFQQHADAAVAGMPPKELFPHYISHYLPMGLKGLILAAIIMASIDSPLSSLSSSFVMDIYRPIFRPTASPGHYLWVSRMGVVGFGVVLAAIAWFCQGAPNVLWLAFQIVSVTGGSLLGVFLLGILTRWGSNVGNVVAMIVNAAAMAVLMILSSYGPIGLQAIVGMNDVAVPKNEPAIVPIAWCWLIVIGTFFTFLLGLTISALSGKVAAGPALAVEPVRVDGRKEET